MKIAAEISDMIEQDPDDEAYADEGEINMPGSRSIVPSISSVHECQEIDGEIYEENVPIREEGVSEAVNEVLTEEISHVLPAQETRIQPRKVDPERFNITGNHFITKSLATKAKKEDAERAKALRKLIREQKAAEKKRKINDENTTEFYVSHQDRIEAGPSRIKVQMPFKKKIRREAGPSFS